MNYSETLNFPPGVAPSEGPPAIAWTTVYAYDAGNKTTYIGYAKSGITPLSSQAVWAIKKLTYAGTGVDDVLNKIEWANGNVSDTNVWDSRAGLTYA